MKIVHRYDGLSDLAKIAEIQKDNSEGFAIRFQSGMRVKVKFEEYVRLHRLLTGVNKKTIWDLLRTGQDLNEMMQRVPEEFYQWVKKAAEDLFAGYTTIRQDAEKIYDRIMARGYKKRKTIAKHFLTHPEYAPILFCMLSNKDYSRIIWMKIKPPAERPFMNKEVK